MKSLYEIIMEHDGKLSDKWTSNIFSYERLFENYRDRPVRILEIGIQNGGSLEIWAKYFPNAVAITGCDIDLKCSQLAYDNPNISVVVGDANDPDIFSKICATSDKFDIIIDDGSHLSGDIVRAFSRFFPILSVGGLYIAEDLHCSYWSNFEGGLEDPGSSLNFFRRLSDLTNLEHWGAPLSAAESLSYFAERYCCSFEEAPLLGITQVAFCNSLAVVHLGTPQERALGKRCVVGQEAIVSTGSVGLHGTNCPESTQVDNPFGPTAPRRETLPSILAERDAMLNTLQQDYAILSNRVATLEAERQVFEDQSTQWRNELAQSRTQISQTAKAFVTYKMLSALARSPLPFGSRTRERFARSAAKRDPQRSLGGS